MSVVRFPSNGSKLESLRMEQPRTRVRSETRLAASDQDARGEDKTSPQHYFRGGGDRRGVHIAPLDVGNRQQLDHDDNGGDHSRGIEARYQIGERMAYAAGDGHEAADEAAQV